MKLKSVRNEYGQTWYQWARELFEFENCAECGEGVRGHEPAGFSFGDGPVLFFARCKEGLVDAA